MEVHTVVLGLSPFSMELEGSVRGSCGMEECDIGRRVRVVLRGKRGKRLGKVAKRGLEIGVKIAGFFFSVSEIYTIEYIG